jgi:hypothetical protein
VAQVVVYMGMSLDGYVAGPNAGPENPLGDRGMRIHLWIYDLEAWRERQSLRGGQTNRDDEVVKESYERVGAYVMGRRMFDERGELAGSPALPRAGVRAHEPREGTVGKAGWHDLHLRHRGHRECPRAGEGSGGRQGRQDLGRRERHPAVFERRAGRRGVHPPRARAARRRGEAVRADRRGQVELECTRVIDSPRVTHLRYRVAR